MNAHVMGPFWIAALYLAAVMLAIGFHVFNLMRRAKLAKLSEANKDARAIQMERNMIYICASHIPMGLAWLGVLSPVWGIVVGLSMLYGESHLAFRSYQRAKQVYGL